ncbi:MAG: D-alanyl-lipoteichoic acid biosynthesis protein DltD [Chloroflexi bacterium]|nr:D-alanyl-lipoteichoic acid biosynthesis protein DltD [Chloroflexota bacterium]
MKSYRLAAALLVILLLLTSTVGGITYARRTEDRYIHALAPQMFSLKNQGTALQASAFRQPDLLPIYGSSELNIANPYHASTLFQTYPTGFTVFPVGKAGTTDLIMLQDMAAVGPDIKGKKVAISLSPPWFFNAMAGADSYAGNFSLLHANALAYSTQVSFAVKQGAARRMLQYPKTLEGDPALKFALERLADGSLLSRAAYYLMLPLGKLWTLVLRLQDHWDTLSLIRKMSQDKKQPLRPEVTRQAAVLDWGTLIPKSIEEQRQHATNNPLGVDDQAWLKTFRDQVAKQKNTRNDAQFLRSLGQAAEWIDLDLLLHGLKDMGVQVLVLSMPLQGTYHQYTGVSEQAHQAYYDKLRQVTQPYGVPVMDFRDHDMDKYFLIDPGAHVSREGWVYYDQALEAFYHDAQK